MAFSYTISCSSSAHRGSMGPKDRDRLLDFLRADLWCSFVERRIVFGGCGGGRGGLCPPPTLLFSLSLLWSRPLSGRLGGPRPGPPPPFFELSPSSSSDDGGDGGLGGLPPEF